MVNNGYGTERERRLTEWTPTRAATYDIVTKKAKLLIMPKMKILRPIMIYSVRIVYVATEVTFLYRNTAAQR